MPLNDCYTVDVRPDGSRSIGIADGWAGGRKLGFRQPKKTLFQILRGWVGGWVGGKLSWF